MLSSIVNKFNIYRLLEFNCIKFNIASLKIQSYQVQSTKQRESANLEIDIPSLQDQFDQIQQISKYMPGVTFTSPGLFIAPKCVKSQNQLPFHSINFNKSANICQVLHALGKLFYHIQQQRS